MFRLWSEGIWVGVRFNVMCLALLVALFTSGCGGGGGGSDDGDINTGSDVTSGTDQTDDSADSDTTSDVTEGLRVARMRYDYDNNGVYEGLSEFFYDSNGRIEEERYSYIDDGLEDQHIPGTIQSWLGREDLDNTVTYTYDANGLMQTWVVRDSELSATTTYAYDANDLLVRVDKVTGGSGGDVRSSTYHSLEYTGQQLTRHTHHNSADDTLLFTYEIGYDPAGYIDTTRMTSNPPGLDMLYSPNYLANGLIDSVEVANPTSTYMGLICSYNDLGQRTLSDVGQGGFGFEYIYGNNGKVSEVRSDAAQDGSVDTVVAVEWEQGVCEPVPLWNAMAHACTLIDPTSPYQPGAGYLYTGHCDQGPL